MKKLAVSLLAATLLWGCSSEPQKPAEKAAPPAPEPSEYMTARAAFQRMYATARGWAPDAQPFRLQSQHSKDAPVAEGKAAVWRAWFASASRRAAKPYQWSGLTGPDARHHSRARGFFQSGERLHSSLCHRFSEGGFRPRPRRRAGAWR
jgi:hypothetical protein